MRSLSFRFWPDFLFLVLLLSLMVGVAFAGQSSPELPQFHDSSQRDIDMVTVDIGRPILVPDPMDNLCLAQIAN